MDENTHRNQAFRKQIQYWLVILIVLIMVAISGVVIYFKTSNYVAVVGSEKVSKPEYSFFLNISKNQVWNNFDGELDPSGYDSDVFWETKFGSETYLEIAKEQAMDVAKKLKVQLIKAKENKLKLSTQELKKIDNIINEDMKKYVGEDENSAVQHFETKFGVSPDEIREIYKEYGYASKLKKETTKNLKFTEADLKAYYNKNPVKFTDTVLRKNAEEAVWLRHILIKTTDENGKKLPANEIEEAKKRAQALLERAKKGEDFIKLAKDNAGNNESITFGIDIVMGTSQTMPFGKVDFNNIEIGGIAGLLESEYGFHIIKLEERIAGGKPVSYRCARESSEFGLSSDRLVDEEYQKKLDEWIKGYEIKINKRILKKFK